jgi:hypothetical protein
MWWIYIVVVALLAFGVYGFVSLVRAQTRALGRKPRRTVEDMYDQFADTPRQQRRYAREHGGTWRPGEPDHPSGGQAGAGQ